MAVKIFLQTRKNIPEKLMFVQGEGQVCLDYAGRCHRYIYMNPAFCQIPY